ncbi:MAG: alpha/beta hydrolase-fold protein [Planctomycetota bacterium]
MKLVAPLSFLVCLAATSPALSAEPELPKPVVKAYESLTDSIVNTKMPVFMKLFEIDYLYEEPDGTTLDRGPWRRLWLERFEAVSYERAAFHPVKVLSVDEEQVSLKVRRVYVTVNKTDGARTLEETSVEDDWKKTSAGWQLVARRVGETTAKGALPSVGTPTSPTLAKLAKSLAAKTPAAETKFWSAITSGEGTPLVEAKDETSRWVTFLWRGNGSETKVSLNGGSPSANAKSLSRLGSSNVWYRTESLPADAVFTYDLNVEREIQSPAIAGQAAATFATKSQGPDPLNSKTLDDRSVAALPGAKKLEGQDAAGSVKRGTIRSRILRERRFVSVYTPPDFDDAGPALPAAFLLDEGNYSSRRATAAVLDKLIEKNRIPRCLVFLVHSEGSKRATLEVTPEFLRFLNEELLAWARDRYPISKKRKESVIGGVGLGATLAAICATSDSSPFGSVLSSSADFSNCVASTEHCVPSLLSAKEKLPLRFFVAVASLEPSHIAASHQHLSDVLRAKSYDARTIRLSGNQNSAIWLQSLSVGLSTLLNKNAPRR